MPSIENVLATTPEFHKQRTGKEVYARIVYKKAVRHILRPVKEERYSKSWAGSNRGKEELDDDWRPHEDDLYKKFRKQNRRHITDDGLMKFYREATAIILNSGIDLNVAVLNENTGEYIEGNNYQIGFKKVSWSEFFIEYCSFVTLSDPNAVVIDIPYNDRDKSIPPSFPFSAGGPNPEKPVPIRTVVIPSSKYVNDSEDHYMFVGGMMNVDGDVNTQEPFYYICDDVNWYLWYPTRDTNGGIAYDYLIWYEHNTGKLPICDLPGSDIVTEKGVYYKESIAKTYYEYMDEVVNTFGDDQIIFNRFAHPHEIVAQLDCVTCKGSGRVKDLKAKTNHACVECDGSGIQKSVGVSGKIVKPKTHADQKKHTDPLLEFVEPTVGILEFSTKRPYDFQMRGNHSLGIDTIGNEAESGVAKKLRMTLKGNNITLLAESLLNCLQSHIIDIDALLNKNEAERKEPQIKRPYRYHVNDPEAIAEQIKENQTGDRFMLEKEYYLTKYRGDNVMLKIHSAGTKWAPLRQYHGEELSVRMNSGYTPSDLLKADNSLFIFREIADEMGIDDFMLATDEALFIKANERFILLTNLGVIPNATNIVQNEIT